MQVLLCFFKRAFLLSFFLVEYFSITAQTAATSKGGIMTSVKSADSTGDVYAIITGISNYPGINPLRYADKDAILFREFLKTPSGGSVKSENILSLINDSAKAADFNVKAYSWLQRKNLKKNDRLYIYFSGHGDAMNDDLYFLLPYDCEPNKDDHNYLGTGNINMYMVKTLFIKPQVQKGVNVIMIIDACRTNELPGGTPGQQSFATSIEQQPVGEIMFLSTGAGQVSIESPTIGNGHGLFTYYLIDGLAGAADKDSSNGDNDGKVSLGEISAYVKTQVSKKARTEFKTTQIPYYCCGEKDLNTISNVDQSTYTAWENSKKAQQMSADQNLFALNTPTQGHKGVMRASDVDTSQIRIYNELLNAMNKENLIGESSAETFYNIMEKNWPGSAITEDAKFSLAAKYINFCQQKINLFLSGKGLVHIIYMEKEISKEKNENSNAVAVTETGEEIKKLKTLVTTGFDIAEKMMEKAVEMLKSQPELTDPILSKLDFLKTMSAYGNKNSKLNDVLEYCRKAIASDPISACGYQLMGWIYQDMQNDSCAYYFNKAATIAPKWAYPMNGLGNFYIARNNKKEAMRFFLKAIELDSLFANAYRNIGMNYYNQKMYDSAKYYFLKALKINPCDSYANENMGSANEDYISPQFGSSYTDSVFFKISRRFFLKSIECDSSFASGYQKLSALYSIAKNEDSALIVLQSCVSVNPKNAEAFRNLGTYYLNKRKDTLQAETYYKKAIVLDPSSGDNYYSLARLYRKRNKDKAIGVLMEALDKIGNNKDLFNEIGNAYFEAPTNFEKAISNYNMALKTDSTCAYIYFNLGKLYGVKDAAKDSSIYYYAKAVSYDPDRFYKINHTIADFYYDNKNFSTAKSFYEQALKTPTFSKNKDVERLIIILVGEGDVAGAQSGLKKYLDPQSDFELYTKLSKIISEAPSKK